MGHAQIFRNQEIVLVGFQKGKVHAGSVPLH